jgi:hypothetical protein
MGSPLFNHHSLVIFSKKFSKKRHFHKKSFLLPKIHLQKTIILGLSLTNL